MVIFWWLFIQHFEKFATATQKKQGIISENLNRNSTYNASGNKFLKLLLLSN